MADEKKTTKKAAKKETKAAKKKRPKAKKPRPKASRKKARAKKLPPKKSRPKAPKRKKLAEAEPVPAVVRASARFVRVAPAQGPAGRRPGAAACTSRSAPRAAAVLPRGAAQDIHKLIESAAANAENNHDLVADDLLISDITRRRGPDAAPLPAARARPRDPDQQANQPHRRGPDTGGRREHGTEDPPRGIPRRLHPRLEVELVQGAKTSPTSSRKTCRSAITSTASFPTRGSRTSRSSAAARSRSTSTRPAPAS